MKSLKFLVFGIVVLLFASCNESNQSNQSIILNAPFEMTLNEITFPNKTFNVIDFGAKEGGEIKCTQAFADAIDAATKAGGGNVIVPQGTYLVGPIELKDNVCIKFDDGTIILFSTDLEDYPSVLSRHQGVDCYKYSSFIYANNATNIGLTGKVIFEGQGKVWWQHRRRLEKQLKEESKKRTDGKSYKSPWDFLVEMVENEVPLEKRVFNDTNKYYLQPCFIMPIYCKNVLIDGVTCKYGAYWTLNPVYCENLIIRNVTIITMGDYGKVSNGDGINLSSCKNALIEDCTLDTGDDCITLKSGRGIDGYKKAMPTKNIVVRNCKSLQGHGGVVIGSEVSGGVRNIYVHDCEFNGTDRGLRIKTARGRGDAIENVWFENIKMGNMINEAIKVKMLRYTSRYPSHEITRMTPRIRNINYKNIECSGAGTHAIDISGLPEMPVQNINIENVTVKSDLGVQMVDVGAVNIKGLKNDTDSDIAVIIDNGSNINFDNTDLTKEIIIKSENSKGIRFIDSKVNESAIKYNNCDNKVDILTSQL